jgi:hypothetical protein
LLNEPGNFDHEILMSAPQTTCVVVSDVFFFDADQRPAAAQPF